MASAAFARISRDVTRLVERIPSGSVTTYTHIGELLDLPARHVAYVIRNVAARTALVPWHRVTGNFGELQKSRADEQASRLRRESVPCTEGPGGGAVTNFRRYRVTLEVNLAEAEATQRPAQYRKQTEQDGKLVALADVPGIGKRSLQWMVEIGITSLQELQRMDSYQVYAQIKRRHPTATTRLLFVLIAAAENRDWREVALSERTTALLRLEDMKLL
jgi:alkylated DNA nucleotide flippase Atl1